MLGRCLSKVTKSSNAVRLARLAQRGFRATAAFRDKAGFGEAISVLEDKISNLSSCECNK
jgi:PII-like signaling protein